MLVVGKTGVRGVEITDEIGLGLLEAMTELRTEVRVGATDVGRVFVVTGSVTGFVVGRIGGLDLMVVASNALPSMGY